MDPIFNDETKARGWLESYAWRNGARCPHCGAQRYTPLNGAAHRSGLYQCNSCRRQFTVTVGTKLEGSRIPLHKWLMAIFIIAASRETIPTRKLQRILGISYNAARLLKSRIGPPVTEDTARAVTPPLA